MRFYCFATPPSLFNISCSPAFNTAIQVFQQPASHATATTIFLFFFPWTKRCLFFLLAGLCLSCRTVFFFTPSNFVVSLCFFFPHYNVTIFYVMEIWTPDSLPYLPCPTFLFSLTVNILSFLIIMLWEWKQLWYGLHCSGEEMLLMLHSMGFLIALSCWRFFSTIRKVLSFIAIKWFFWFYLFAGQFHYIHIFTFSSIPFLPHFLITSFITSFFFLFFKSLFFHPNPPHTGWTFIK